MDAFVLGMDSYVMGGEEEGYITWIGQRYEDIKNKMVAKGILNLTTYYDPWAKYQEHIYGYERCGRLVLSTSFLLSIIRWHNSHITGVR
jgi:hypothetical protein